MTFTVLTGPFDGVQTDFMTDADYISGTVRAFTPNLQAESVVSELGGKTVRLCFAPLPGDVIYLFYRSVNGCP